MAELRIARDLALPLDAVTQAIGILARRGAGKTHTASVLVEEVISAGLPVVVLDPTGAWWGLRTSADGQQPGLPVVIFGGEHGDVPLERSAGKVIADVVVEHPGAYVIDLSGFESRAAEHTFAADFLERLYRAKATDRDALLVVVDEADTFAPQRPGPEQTRTLGALEAIVRRGRIRGLGVVLISQRSAVLNKNVLTQIEVLVAMQTTGPQDRAAIDEWVKGNGSPDEREAVMGSLASLERGEAWVWSPSWLRILQRVRIRTRKTFDSSKTPEAGETAVTPKAFAPVDLERLGKRIADTVDKAKADDPRELRRRIAELERAAAATSVPEVKVERIEVPVLNGQVDKLDDVVRRLTTTAMAVGNLGKDIGGIALEIVSALDRVSSAPRTAQQVATPVRTAPGTAGRLGASTGAAVPRTRGTEPATTRDPAQQAAVGAPLDRPLKAGARRMLSALAMLHPTPLTRGQVATLSDISPTSGTFSDYLSAIRSAGLIVEDGRTISLSATGQELVAGELGRGAPSSDELLEMWGRKLKAGARRMLGVLHEVYPEGLTRAELGERAEISPTSGTFSDYLSMLRRNGLLDESGSLIRAGEALFLGGRR